MNQQDIVQNAQVSGRGHLKPPFVVNSHNVTMDEAVDNAQLLMVREGLIEFAVALIRMVSASPHQCVGIDAVAQKVGVSESTARRWLSDLSISGILESQKFGVMGPSGKKRAAVTFSLTHPSADKIQAARNKAKAAAARIAGSGNVATQRDIELMPQQVGEASTLYLNMMMSALFPVMSYTQKDHSSSRKMAIRTEWGETLTVSAASRGGTPLARLTDLVAWTGLLSICLTYLRERAAEGLPLDNKFVMPAMQVARALGIPKATTLMATMERLNATEICLESIPMALMARWGVDQGTLRSGFIHDFSPVRLNTVNAPGERKPWVLCWLLPLGVFDLLVKKVAQSQGKLTKLNLISLTSDLLKEDNNVVVALHLYCRRALARRTEYRMTLHQLHRAIAPAMTGNAFMETLGAGIVALYRREISHSTPMRASLNVDGAPTKYIPTPPQLGRLKYSALPITADVCCYGFIVTVAGDEVLLEKNPYDPIVGLASASERHRLVNAANLSRSDLDVSLEDIDMDF